MRHVLLVPLAVLLLAGPAARVGAAEDAPAPKAQPGDTIQWVNDVAKAFEKAAQQRKPVMICINSQRVDDGKVEPAARGLREVVYQDPRVVELSRRFVCVFLTSAGSSGDYGELRARFGIDGKIVSPQHIFAHPDHQGGQAPLVRKEFWPYGKDEPAVKALLDLMQQALKGFEAREGRPETPGEPGAQAPLPPVETPPAPAGDDEHKAWIETLLGIVQNGPVASREEAVRSLVANDKDGDCVGPLLALLPVLDEAKKVPELITVVRGLGVPGLTKAALAIHDFLRHKDDSLRANTAVTLEYIGSPESVKDLMARAAREKDELIANHIYRALGRCGAGDAKVRAALIKEAKGSKSEDASFGPIVGLAYSEKDAKTARAVEKLLGTMGPPGGGRRGGARGTMKRGLLAWTLGEIADPKSAEFVREKLLKPLENAQGWWVTPVVTYYEAIARRCEGDEKAKDDIDNGIRRTLEFSGGTLKFQDAARQGRDKSKFEPKAEWELEARSFGGGPGGGPGGGGN